MTEAHDTVHIAGSDETEGSALDLVDLEKYPIHTPDGDGYRQRLEAAWRELDDDGCCVLPGFIRADRLAELESETRELSPLAQYSSTEATVYGTEADIDVEPDHPLRHQVQRDNGFVAGDLIGPEVSIRRLYHADEFQAFIRDCLGLEEIHEYADSIAQLVINVVRPGSGHGWHFDSNEFTVTLLTASPDDGGRFEYAPHIRDDADEHFADVRSVLRGDHEPVKHLDLRVGDLQVFRGRYSLHRVTNVTGDRNRLTAIFSYSRQPGVTSDPVRTKRLYGRTNEDGQTSGAGTDRDGT